MSLIIDRIHTMGAPYPLPQTTGDLKRLRTDYLNRLESLISDINGNRLFNDIDPEVKALLLECVQNYRNDIQSNHSMDSLSVSSQGEVFSWILKTMQDGDWLRGSDALVLFIQLYGNAGINPLLKMKGTKLVNGAWRNGSIDGYPAFLLIDSMNRTNLSKVPLVKKCFKRTCSENHRMGDIVIQLLKLGQFNEAKVVFGFLMSRNFPNHELSELWNCNFSKLIMMLKGNCTATKHDRDHTSERHRKIMVSGMGWSGSGALFAYLREFHHIQCVDAEIQHLTGLHGLSSLRAQSQERNSFMNQMIDHFFTAILGLSRYQDYQGYRAINNTGPFVYGSHGKAYAEGVSQYLDLILSNVQDFPFSSKTLSAAADILLSTLAGCSSKSGDEPSNKVLLFDNVIKVHQLGEISSLENAKLVAVVRDPRSNYVALCRESVKFNPSASDYIQFYRNRRLKTQKELEKLSCNDSVKVIRFEDFVNNEKFRKEIAGWLGLDLQDRNEFTHFKPWISQKNVENYRDFPDQKAIRLIERELPEYLYHS